MRAIQDFEMPLVQWMLNEAGRADDASTLLVEEMEDGRMGSLRFPRLDRSSEFGTQASECHFKDADGVLVSATLNLDAEENLFELDVWKVDFTPLIRWPILQDIIPGEPNPSFKRMR